VGRICTVDITNTIKFTISLLSLISELLGILIVAMHGMLFLNEFFLIKELKET
jgi:hypothetical protein